MLPPGGLPPLQISASSSASGRSENRSANENLVTFGAFNAGGSSLQPLMITAGIVAVVILILNKKL